MARRTKDAPPKTWGNRKLVVLEGGPRDGRWYFIETVRAHALAAERMGNRWPYEATTRSRLHPDYSASGKVHMFVAEPTAVRP